MTTTWWGVPLRSVRHPDTCSCPCHNGTGDRPDHAPGDVYCAACREERDAIKTQPFVSW